jgi:hypothetical protein
MSLNDFSTVAITAQGPALTQVGFGTLLCAGYHTKFAARARTYTATTDMVTDGFLTTDPLYLMAQRAFQQKPRPPSVKVGRLALPFTQSVKFGVQGAAQNLTVYSFTATRGAVTAVISFTSDSTATIAEIVTGLAAAVEASTLAAPLIGVTADTATTCQITDTVPGTITYYSNWSDNLTFSDVTTDPGIATDLAAIRTYDADWYGLAIDLNSKAITTAAANWAETQLMLFASNTSDSAVFDSASTTDVAYTLKALTLGRTLIYFSYQTTQDYSGVAAFAERSTHDPGTKGAGGTWHAKVLTGRPADALTPTMKANLRAKNVNTFIATANRNHTLDGKVIGGEWADKVRFLDWFGIRLQERVATAELNNDVIPYDDRGISIMLGEVNAMLAIGIAAEGIVAGTETSSAPLSAAVSSADRAARTLNNVAFGFRIAGAIHLTNITGTVTN